MTSVKKIYTAYALLFLLVFAVGFAAKDAFDGGFAAAVPSTTPPAFHQIDPLATDPALTGPYDSTYDYYAYAPKGTQSGRLFVWIPGTTGFPKLTSLIEQTAAEVGLHSLGLVYMNDKTINYDICLGKPEPCRKNARIETITGQDVSPEVAVNRTNSIENRLIKFLQYLNTAYPSEGWGQYLSGGQPVWSKIVVAGHSQGGGHAAMIATLYSVDRSLLFSSTEPATWTKESHATPSSRYYGFANTKENDYTAITQSWQNLGFSGSLTSVDGASPPFSNSHRLTTSAEPRGTPPSNNPYHGVVVTNPYTPLATDGTPLFRPVWVYMMGGTTSPPPPPPGDF